MSTASSLIGAGVGASLMFMLDPSRGARRRALVRDKVVRVAHKTREAADATQRDLSNRLSGLGARTGAQLADEAADDRVVCERVRAELGRVASHPRAILVESNGGVITLAGDVLAAEVSSICSRVNGVRGVREVHNHMTLHANAAGIPALQGESRRPGWGRTRLAARLSPSAMVLTGIGTAAVVFAALANGRD